MKIKFVLLNPYPVRYDPRSLLSQKSHRLENINSSLSLHLTHNVQKANENPSPTLTIARKLQKQSVAIQTFT